MIRVGLDVHYRSATLCILDDTGKEVNTITLRGGIKRTIDYLRDLARTDQLAVCYEASLGYGHLFDQLSAFCSRVVVAHGGQLRLIFRSKQKNDRVDARKLAKLLWLDEVPQVHVPSVDVRAWRELIETRRRMVDRRTMSKNAIKSVLRSRHVEVPFKGRSIWTKKGLAWLAGLSIDAMSDLRIRLALAELRLLELQIQQVTDELDTRAAKHPGVRVLMTIPGVGVRTAETIVAYIDQISRFARTRQVASYFGMVPSQDSSGAIHRSGHITKQGPGTARKVLVEGAWQAIRRSGPMRAYFERISAGKKERRKIALVATAHKLVRIMSAMLRTGEPWREEGPAAAAVAAAAVAVVAA